MEQFETLFYLLKKSTDRIYDLSNQTYLNCISINITQFLEDSYNEEIEYNEEDMIFFEAVYDEIRDISYTTEEIRRSLQLLILSGLKTDSHSFISTPDKIGAILAFFVNGLLKKTDCSLLDPLVGTGNLMAVLSNEISHPMTLYGVDFEYDYLSVCKAMFNMMDTEIHLFYQNILSFQSLCNIDMIVSDVPSYNIGTKVTYFPYQLILHVKNALRENGYMLLLVDPDFFYHNEEEEKKEVLKGLTVAGFVEMPEDLFVSTPKSLVILQKSTKKETNLLLSKLPRLEDEKEFAEEISKINIWFQNRKEEKENE